MRLTAEKLRETLSYDPETGEFTWMVRLSSRRMPGQSAGTPCKNGYKHISVLGRMYYAHRLAWFYVHGEWPPECIDHINGKRSDNRIANLRLATVSQNNANSKLPCSNTSGFKGVVWLPKNRKWRAQIKRHRKMFHLGCFDSKEAAAAAYRAAAVGYHGDFVRTEPSS